LQSKETIFSSLCLRAYENGCAQGALDCGGSTPPLSSSSALFQGGGEPPQSKALRAFSCAVASRRLMGICGEIPFGLRPAAALCYSRVVMRWLAGRVQPFVIQV